MSQWLLCWVLKFLAFTISLPSPSIYYFLKMRVGAKSNAEAQRILSTCQKANYKGPLKLMLGLCSIFFGLLISCQNVYLIAWAVSETCWCCFSSSVANRDWHEWKHQGKEKVPFKIQVVVNAGLVILLEYTVLYTTLFSILAILWERSGCPFTHTVALASHIYWQNIWISWQSSKSRRFRAPGAGRGQCIAEGNLNLKWYHPSSVNVLTKYWVNMEVFTTFIYFYCYYNYCYSVGGTVDKADTMVIQRKIQYTVP